MTSQRKQAPCAIADLDSGTTLARVDIAAPIERVWRALTTDELTRWWGSDANYRTTRFEIELRVGGRWHTAGRGVEGRDFHVDGRVLELEAPRKLVHTWIGSWAPSHETTVAYALAAIDDGGGTRVTLRHSGFVGRAAAQLEDTRGWEQALGWLAAFAAPPAQPRYFLCRLIPPRPTFTADMTADERAVMQAHVAYWRGKLADGAVIAFGPVDDPAGGYGLGLVAARDDDAVRAFAAADPAIAAGIGMRYETVPMFALVY